MTGPVRVVLIGKPGCHLCDDVRPTVAAVCADLGVGWEERSILDDDDLHDRYWDVIPVVLVDGVEVGLFRLDEAALRTALAG